MPFQEGAMLHSRIAPSEVIVYARTSRQLPGEISPNYGSVRFKYNIRMQRPFFAPETWRITAHDSRKMIYENDVLVCHGTDTNIDRSQLDAERLASKPRVSYEDFRSRLIPDNQSTRTMSCCFIGDNLARFALCSWSHGILTRGSIAANCPLRRVHGIGCLSQ
jgi:hypothetical protein